MPRGAKTKQYRTDKRPDEVRKLRSSKKVMGIPNTKGGGTDPNRNQPR